MNYYTLWRRIQGISLFLFIVLLIAPGIAIIYGISAILERK